MLTELLSNFTGLLAGSAIGYGFGLFQQAALRRNEERQLAGKLKNGWTLMPGSGGRVALLLIVLALIQVICPLLFRDNTQWWVSGGVALGYGWVLFQQIRRNKNKFRA
jgi:hypothetical protein